jgi:putative oxidoreductase
VVCVRLVLPEIMSQILHLVRRAYERFVGVVNLLQSPLLLALRAYFFWQLFQTGQGKLSNIGKIIDFFKSLGIPAPTINAYFVSSLECFGGLLLIIGLASRPIALMVAASMFVAYWTADHEALTNMFSDPDKFVQAAPFSFLLTALIVLAFGPGLLSADALLKRVIGRKTPSVSSRPATGITSFSRDKK